jgi:hypothetical protein
MDLKGALARIPCMSTRLRRFATVQCAVGLLVAVASLGAGPASADVGVEKVSRLAGAPGDPIDLTLACGFCFPPCHGAPGHRNTPCMLDTKAQPPKEFSVSLVPIEKAPKPHRCGPNALCSPLPRGAPRRAPYTYLGRAVPPADGNSGASGKHPPRYLLHLEVPDLRPGVYAYVIFCDVCARGKRGSLIANPRDRRWRLRVLSSAPRKSGPAAAVDGPAVRGR